MDSHSRCSQLYRILNEYVQDSEGYSLPPLIEIIRYMEVVSDLNEAKDFLKWFLEN